MKTTILIFIAGLLLVTACGDDNYKAPSSRLSGKVTYDGASIGVRGTGQSVQLQLFQNGYAFKTPIPVNVSQDGSFSAELFDGDYELVARDQNGPWQNKHDTVHVAVRGNTQADYPVTPYYTISNEDFTVTGDTLYATFDVTEISVNDGIEYVALMVNKTTFVDMTTNVRKVSEAGTTGTISLKLPVGDLSNAELFARVAVKTQNVGEPIYSTIPQIK